MLSLKEPQVQRLGLPNPTLSSVHLQHSPIDLHCQDFLSQCLKSEVFVDFPGDYPILSTMKGLTRNQLERIPIDLGRTAPSENTEAMFLHKIRGHWLPLSFFYFSQFPSLGLHPTPPPPPPQRAGSNCKAIPATISGNWSERCRQRGPLHSSLFTRSMYPIKGF